MMVGLEKPPLFSDLDSIGDRDTNIPRQYGARSYHSLGWGFVTGRDNFSWEHSQGVSHQTSRATVCVASPRAVFYCTTSRCSSIVIYSPRVQRLSVERTDLHNRIVWILGFSLKSGTPSVPSIVCMKNRSRTVLHRLCLRNAAQK